MNCNIKATVSCTPKFTPGKTAKCKLPLALQTISIKESSFQPAIVNSMPKFSINLVKQDNSDTYKLDGELYVPITSIDWHPIEYNQWFYMNGYLAWFNIDHDRPELVVNVKGASKTIKLEPYKNTNITLIGRDFNEELCEKQISKLQMLVKNEKNLLFCQNKSETGGVYVKLANDYRLQIGCPLKGKLKNNVYIKLKLVI